MRQSNIQADEAKIIQSAFRAEALKIPVVWLRRDLEYPDANTTNNHSILTGKIVLAHLKEMLDYYLRLEVAELEGDRIKAFKKGDNDKLAHLCENVVVARAD